MPVHKRVIPSELRIQAQSVEAGGSGLCVSELGRCIVVRADLEVDLAGLLRTLSVSLMEHQEVTRGRWVRRHLTIKIYSKSKKE